MTRCNDFPNLNPDPGQWVKKLAGHFKTCIAILFVVLSTNSFAQVVLPPANIDCPSKDLEVTQAILPAPANDPCSCSGTRKLQLGIINKTGSDRAAFAMWGKLIRRDPYGNQVGNAEIIFACAPSIRANSTAFYETGTSIPVACNESLVIVDVILAWTSANKKETCDVLYNSPSTINPKCGRVDSIRVETGVAADLVRTNATCTSGGSITVSPYGGTAPYKVKIGTDERTNILAGGSTTFSSLPAGDYNIVITDSRPCSTNRSSTVSAPASISAPATEVMQPTCTVSTGTVNITSADNTVTYTLKQSGVIKYTAVNGVFSTVAAGTYEFVAAKGTCSTTGSQVIVNTQPQTPGTPTANVTQPTCAIAKGTITVTSPLGTGITYSINGTDYQAGTTFNNVNAGTYNVTAMANGCTSGSTSKTVNVQPATPNAPSANVTQPTCSIAKGTITITAPLGAGITYSINGADYQSGTIFNNVEAGTYNVTASANGCTSGSTSKTVNAQPETPDAPFVCIVQPSLCGPATGSITVTSPLGSGFEYSILNGIEGSWQASNVFNNVAAGSVTGIKVKSPAGCISAAADCDASACSQTGARSQTTASKQTIAATTVNIPEMPVDQLAVKAFPNPYTDKVRLVVSSPVTGQGSIEVVNMLGQKIKVVYQGRIIAGNQAFDVNIPTAQRSTLIYIFRMGGRQITGKLLQLTQ